jgi:hypothetical protein
VPSRGRGEAVAIGSALMAGHVRVVTHLCVHGREGSESLGWGRMRVGENAGKTEYAKLKLLAINLAAVFPQHPA